VALGRLLAEADGGRFPDRHATVGQALDKFLEVARPHLPGQRAHVAGADASSSGSK